MERKVSVLRMNDRKIANEILELHRQISDLRDLVLLKIPAPPAEALEILVGRGASERKPFLLTIGRNLEKSIGLSSIRAAITLTLLLDLEQRSSGKAGILSIQDSSAELFRLLSPGAYDEGRLQEQTRVALYRFADFWRDEMQEVLGATFDPMGERLSLSKPEPFVLDIRSSDQSIEDALLFFGRTPMLLKLQRERYLFVPGEGRSAERFLYEIYSSAGTLEVLSTYARLQLITVPPWLMQKYHTVPEAVDRHSEMHRMLVEGRLKFTEILPMEGFEELVELGPDSLFAYFPNMELSELIDHLRFVYQMMSSQSGYRLILMRSEIPFFVGRYDSPKFGLTSFFKFPKSGLAAGYSSFAIWGPDLGEMAGANFFDWLMKQPAALCEPKDVLEYLESVIQRLCNEDAKTGKGATSETDS